MKRTILALAAAASIALSPAVIAQASPSESPDFAALRNAVRTDKRAYVAAALELAAAEAKKFWPIYDAYQRRIELTNTRRARLLEDIVGRDKAISDRYAKMLIAELVSIEEEEAKSQRTMARRVERALPTRKAARYIQIENKIHAMQVYDVASTMPLVR